MTSTDPVPRSWGWPVRGGGRAGHVEAGNRFAGTTSQVCGLFPFATPSGCDVRGVPIGRHLHTAEPIGLDPAHWLRCGLVSNTGVWVQGQPGIGKSSITKRMLAGLVEFGMRAVIPGDVKGEYTPLVTALGGSVWHLGRGREALNPDAPTETRQLLEWGLRHPGRIPDAALPMGDPHGRLRFVIRELGQLGDDDTAALLEPWAADPDVGNSAVEEIRRLRSAPPYGDAKA